MSYEVGQYIDLSHLNGGGTTVPTKSETTSYEPGTEFVFTPPRHGKTFQMARRIPVAFA